MVLLIERPWMDLALEAIHELALVKWRFNSDAVWYKLPKAVRDKIHEPRNLGPVFIQAKAFGWITPTKHWVKSYRLVNHHRDLRMWQSCLIKEPL